MSPAPMSPVPVSPAPVPSTHTGFLEEAAGELDLEG